MTNRLPEKLTALRKHFGYSQGDMAEKLMVPVAEYMNWENGNTICRIDQLRRLSRIYRVPIEDLADNTRSVTLPRLDEDDDSIQISFTGTTSADVLSEIGAAPATEEEAADFADNLIAKTSVTPQPQNDFRNETIVFPETTVNEIADEPEEEYEEEEEAYEPEKPVRRAAPHRREKAGFDFGALLGRIDRRTLLIGGGVLAALVVVITGINLIRGLGGSTTVPLSDTNRLALGSSFSLYLPSEGTLVSQGQNVPDLESEGLVQVSAGPNWAMGLKKDGTVVCAGAQNACKVEDWEGIVMIAAGENHSVGLKKDGTVECNGSSGACDVSEWKDVKSVYAGNEITIGITDTGTALVSGNFSSIDRIKALSAVRSAAIGNNQIAIVGQDGSVNCYAVGSGSTSNTSAWTGMSQAAVGGSFAAGLSNGKVTAAANDENIVKTVEEWSGIQYIAARNNTLIAVNAKGTVIGAGDNTMGVYNANDADPEETEDPEDSEQLKKVSNVKYTVTSANLQITWDKVENADYYTVKINTSPETSLKTEKPSASVSTDKLRSGNTYVITITACSKDQEKHKDSEPLVVNYQFEANLTKLAQPAGISISQDGTSLNISWNPVNNAGHYEVTIEDISQSVAGTSVSFNVDGWPAKDFTVYITAYPKDGDTRYTFSDPGTATGTYKVEKKDLGTPEFNEVVPGQDGTLYVSWTAVDHAGGYTVSCGDQTQSVAGTSVTFTGLVPGGEYTIRITANPSDTNKYNPGKAATRNITMPAAPAPTQEPTPTPEEPTPTPEQTEEPTPTPEG